MSGAALDNALEQDLADRARLLVALPEDQWFERKSARVQPKDVAVTEVALANAEGGWIVVGLHDGKVEDVPPQRLNDLRQASFDHTQPPVRAHASEIEVLSEEGRVVSLLAIRVEPGEVVHELTNGDCYLRVGDESRRLSFGQRQELQFDRGHAPYDGTVVAGVPIQVVTAAGSADEYRQVLGARSVETMLLARSLMTPSGVTVAAVLLFAEHPEMYFPHAQVRVLRYGQTDRGSGSRQALDDDSDIRYEGRIPVVIHDAAAAVERLVPKRRVLARSGKFEAVSIVPRDAWLEGLVNAVIHRSYSAAGDHIRVEIFPDRIEIESPGRFPGIVDTDKPLSISRYSRNPRIARVCTDLSISQELGEGIKRIFDEMRRRGLTDPVYEQSAASVRLTLWAKDAIDEAVLARLSPGAQRVLQVLRRAAQPLGTGQIVELTGQTRPTVLGQLRSLQRQDLVVWEGHSKKDPRATWRVR